MTNGLSVPITADTRQFQAEVSNVSDQLAAVSDQLDAVTGAGDSAGTSIDAAMQKAQASTAAAGGVFRQNTQVIQQATDDQTGVVLAAVDDQGRIVKEGVKGTAAALASTLAQSASGLDGTLEGVASSATNIFSMLSYGLAGIGPEFAIGAAAAALGFGLIDGWLKQDEQSAANLRAEIASMVGDLIKAGTDGAVPLSDLKANLKDLATETDSSKTSLADLDDTSKAAGSSATDLADAYAGEADGLKQLIKAAQEKADADAKVTFTAQGQNVILGDQADKIAATAAAQQKYTDFLKTAEDVQSKASEQTKDYNEAVQALGQTTEGIAAAQQAQMTAAAAAFSDIGSKISAEQEKLNEQATAASAQTKKTVVADNVETAQSFIDEQAAELKNLIDTNTAKIEIYEKFGTDAGKAILKDAGSNLSLLQSLAGATPAQVSKILEQYSEVGAAASTNLVKSAQDAATKSGPILVPSQLVAFDVDQMLAQAQAQANRKVLKLKAGVYLSDGRKLV